jgi:membrane glycosyltransferase
MTIAMLLIPKLWGLIETWTDVTRRERQGGAVKLLASVLIESVMSCLLAPAMMVFHTRFVINTLRGRKITWNRQNRDDSQLTWSTARKHFGILTLVGLSVSLAILFAGSASLYWFLPISLGWAATLPFSVLTSRSSIGQKLQDWRLLLVPEETALPAVLQYKQRNQEWLHHASESPGNIAALDSPHFMNWASTPRG